MIFTITENKIPQTGIFLIFQKCFLNFTNLIKFLPFKVCYKKDKDCCRQTFCFRLCMVQSWKL